MIRKITLILPLLAAGCATPALSGSQPDEQRWFDERIAEGYSADGAPPEVPDKVPARSAEEIEEAAEAVLEAREELLESERATRDSNSDTESYAQDARERAEPPNPID
ncbi:hypothetical protein [Hyphobacterium sp.]|uniref:hypothetical protein n=1 Tax=Hyphobacterium sp. TaxID=2004662 RepID=UPI003BAB1B72